MTNWFGLALILSYALVAISDTPHAVWAPTRGVTRVVADPRPGFAANFGARGPTVIPYQVAVTFWLWGLALILSHAPVGSSDPPHAGWALTLGLAHRDASLRLGLAAHFRTRGTTFFPNQVPGTL